MDPAEQEFIFNHSKRAKFEMCRACNEYLDTNFDYDDESDESGDTLRSVRQPSSWCVSGGDPCLSAKGDALYNRLKEEEFDCNPQVVLMEVLRRLGPKKATRQHAAFALGLVEKRYVCYVGEPSESFSFDVEYVAIDGPAYVREKLMKRLDKFGVITKEEYEALREESYTIQIKSQMYCLMR